MIVGVPKTWWRMLLTLRGTSIRYTWQRLLITTLLAVAVTALWETHDLHRYSLSTTPFSLISVALGIFLGFKNNASYDRFWEARKLWGRMVNTSRTWARQVETLINAPASADAAERAELEALKKTLVYRQMGYVHAFRMHLRDGGDGAELDAFIGREERESLRAESNRPNAIVHRTGQLVRDAWRRGWIHDMHLPVLEASMTEILNVQGGCERIKATPVPWVYNVLTHRIVFVYCFALPFGVHDTAGLLTPVVVAMIAFAFYGLDAIGDEIEEPFGEDANDLPLLALSRMIEVNLRQRLAETDLPPQIKPHKGLLI